MCRFDVRHLNIHSVPSHLLLSHLRNETAMNVNSPQRNGVPDIVNVIGGGVSYPHIISVAKDLFIVLVRFRIRKTSDNNK